MFVLNSKAFVGLHLVSLKGNTEPFEMHNGRDENIKRTEEGEWSGEALSATASARLRIRLTMTP